MPEKRKKIKWRRVICLAAVFLVLAMLPVFADEGDKFADFYLRNAKLLETNGIISSALRSVGWLFVNGLVTLGEATQNIYDTAFGFIDLTTFPQVNEFIQRFRPVFVALTAISLAYLGVVLIMQHEKKPNVVINICIAVLCVSCSTFMFNTLNDMTHAFKADMDGYRYEQGRDENAVYDIVNNNMHDVLKLYKAKGLSLSPDDYGSVSTGVTEENFSTFDINEVINYDNTKLGLTSDNPFKYRISGTDQSGKPMIVENDNGWGINSGDDADFGNEFYYRYNFQYMSAFIELAALIIIYIAMAYKVFRVAFELVLARLLAYLYSAELSGGEKIKKILVFIRDSYILLGVSLVCIRLYQIVTAMISAQVGNSLVSALFSLFLAFVVIDGPNLVERLLGMDVGLKSSTARLLAAWGTARGITRAGTGLVFGDRNKGIGHEMRGKGAIQGGIDAFNNKKNKNNGNSDGKTAPMAAAFSASKPGTQAPNNSPNSEAMSASSSQNQQGQEESTFEGGIYTSDKSAGAEAAERMDRPDGNGEKGNMSKSDTFSPKHSGMHENINSSMPKKETRTKSSYFSDEKKGMKNGKNDNNRKH